jgi:hypothetical protein
MAIAGAAYLTDVLKDLVNRENVPSQASVEEAFRDYQQGRGPISRGLVEGAHAAQRLEALETTFLKFFQLKLARFLSLRIVGFKAGPVFNAGLPLKYLPLPARPGTVPIRGQVDKKVSKLLSSVIKVFIFLLVPIFLGYHLLGVANSSFVMML